MKKLALILWAFVLAALVSSPARGAIVYSGSQNVVLKLSPMSPMDSQVIEIAGDRGDWDDFRIDLWLESDMMGSMGSMGMTMYPMGMMGMLPSLSMGMGTKLAIFAPGAMGMGKGMGMGAVLGHQDFATKLGMGMAVNPDFSFVNGVYLHGSGEFGAEGGYIGLLTAMGQYGWLHLARQSNIDTDTHSVVFDSWAYEQQPGVPIVAGQGATCDWVRGRPYKMHWPQLPDLSRMGIDISLERTVLADDFKCTATGPITDIHIWGSFRDDILPKAGPGSLKFEVSIYSDIPATTKSWSRPGELLWKRTFVQGEYNVRRVHDGPEDWFDLATGVYMPANHRGAWQYNFCIDRDPFTQKEGTIYWLVVKNLSVDGNYAFGWKTTSPKQTWNDNTVFLVNESVGWTSLAYPKSHGYAMQSLGLAFVITADEQGNRAYDLGDAPDSSNSVAGADMEAYPGVVGYFPTVYGAGSPPYGPLHRWPRDRFYLGKGVTLETEADVGADEDTVNNLDPLNDAANQDGGDDGLHLPVVMPAFQMTTIDYDVTSAGGALRVYVNVWCDWNRDGDWDDALLSPSGDLASEWAVQNHVVSLPGTGTYTFTSPALRSWHPTKDAAEPLWMRVMVTDRQIYPVAALAGARGGGGQGPAEGFDFGETEDYLVQPRTDPPGVKYDWGDAPETAAAAGYPTRAAGDGARHIPAGPWLGDDKDMPDSEADGQPDPNALGDNLNGGDDENGASVPPLVPGEPESATVRVNGGGGVVQAWIDFNRDRNWQASEKIHDGFLPDGIHVLPFTTPNTALPGWTFARFRISTEGNLEPTGPAKNGEVEDYEVRIEPVPTNPKRWCQRPDLTPYGIDIRVDNGDGIPRVLADDFGCKSPGQLTHVRLWGSWRDDHKGEIKKIRLRIYGDDPVGIEGYDQKNQFSKPRPEVLWEKEYLAGQFTETLYHTVRIAGEWWWDTVSNKAVPGGDTQVWRVDMDIDPTETFVQDGTPENPRIYWLAVEAEVSEGEFGWKTRRWPEHFMDDAVWDAVPSVPRVWEELRYPAGHRFFEHQYNSVDMAFCLLFQTGTTPQATSQPVAVTQCPPVETTCPALLTTCPTVETECPSSPTRCPVVATQCPAVLTRCPPTPTECQVGQTVCPAVETRCPVVETKCPPVSTKCPEALTTCPPTATECQVVETQCPVVETKCPAVQTKCPESATKCPPTATQCQAVDTQCPVVETRCPPVETKCPPTSTQCPGVLTQCPPTPTLCQAVDTQCPVTETRCPPVDTKCPPVSTQCPESLTKCPPTATECQVIETECPVVQTRCPPVATKCPPTATECQVVDTQCPAVQTKCPPVQTKCPPVQTECPAVSTECPTSLTQCPATLSRCQVIETQCPALQTQCPPVQTECPAVSTQCPTALTKCPPTSTECQTVQTECPAVTTRCPPVFTQCPATSSICIKCIGLDAGSPSTQEDDLLAARCPTIEGLCPTLGDYQAFARAVR